MWQTSAYSLRVKLLSGYLPLKLNLQKKPLPKGRGFPVELEIN